MKIASMFERDIDRDINGVIKMDVSDEDVLEQELSEYVEIGRASCRERV